MIRWGLGLSTTLISYSHCPGRPITWDTKAQGSQRGALSFHPEAFHQQPQASARRTAWPASSSWTTSLSSPKSPVVLTWGLLGTLWALYRMHFTFCRMLRQKWVRHTQNVQASHLEIFPQSALGPGEVQWSNKQSKDWRRKRNRWKRTLVNRQNRPLSLNVQELTSQCLHLVLKHVWRAFRHACCPRNSGRVSTGILASLDQESSLSARAPNDHKEVS